MVSLVRIKGTDCKALELGQVADKTGGQVSVCVCVCVYRYVHMYVCGVWMLLGDHSRPHEHHQRVQQYSRRLHYCY